MEVEHVIALTPCNTTVVALNAVGLALNAALHDVVPANSTGLHAATPAPDANGSAAHDGNIR